MRPSGRIQRGIARLLHSFNLHKQEQKETGLIVEAPAKVEMHPSLCRWESGIVLPSHFYGNDESEIINSQMQSEIISFFRESVASELHL